MLCGVGMWGCTRVNLWHVAVSVAHVVRGGL